MNPKKNQSGKQGFTGRVRAVRLGIFGLLLLLVPLNAGASELQLGTGEAGSFSHFSGRLLCRILAASLPDVTCKVQAAADEIDNLTNLQNGSMDLALVDAKSLYNAVTKSGVFRFVGIGYDNLAVLTPLYDLPVSIIVRRDAGIATLDDLKNKRVNGGALGSYQRQTMEMIMQAKGWKVTDFEVFQELPSSHAQDTMVFCHGTVQAMIGVGVHPNPTVQRLLENCNAGLLAVVDPDIDKLVAASPYLWSTEIRADSYPPPSNRVKTFGTRVVLAASADMDDQLAEAIVKALYENKKRLQGGHPALTLYAPEEAAKGVAKVALHPGAARFLSQ